MDVGIVEPVPGRLQTLLRRAVLDLTAAERRRRSFPPALQVGIPGGSVVRFEPQPDEPDDLALRVDVVQAMVRRLGRRPTRPLVWLARADPVHPPEDTDLGWLSATRAAAGELGLALPFVVVGRRAWVDPVTGVGREWQRPPRTRPR